MLDGFMPDVFMLEGSPQDGFGRRHYDSAFRTALLARRLNFRLHVERGRDLRIRRTFVVSCKRLVDGVSLQDVCRHDSVRRAALLAPRVNSQLRIERGRDLRVRRTFVVPCKRLFDGLLLQDIGGPSAPILAEGNTVPFTARSLS